MDQPQFSIIIPVRNEERSLGRTLENVLRVFVEEKAEVIVVDGASRDGTVRLAEGFAGVRTISAPPGRGGQLNRGAAAADGEVLLFLHADTLLPPPAAALIREALAQPGAVGGCFRVRTVAGPGRSRLFRLLLRTADWRSRFARLPYGDQAVFVRREVFRRLGGYRDYPIMEDLEFARRLRREGRIVRVRGAVEVSGRRWEKNLLGNFLKLKTLPLLFRLGVPPERLARFYREAR